MSKKQQTISLDPSELVGFNQVASVSPEKSALSLSSLGRLLSKKGGMEAVSRDGDEVVSEVSAKQQS